MPAVSTAGKVEAAHAPPHDAPGVPVRDVWLPVQAQGQTEGASEACARRGREANERRPLMQGWRPAQVCAEGGGPVLLLVAVPVGTATSSRFFWWLWRAVSRSPVMCRCHPGGHVVISSLGRYLAGE